MFVGKFGDSGASIVAQLVQGRPHFQGRAQTCSLSPMQGGVANQSGGCSQGPRELLQGYEPPTS